MNKTHKQQMLIMWMPKSAFFSLSLIFFFSLSSSWQKALSISCIWTRMQLSKFLISYMYWVECWPTHDHDRVFLFVASENATKEHSMKILHSNCCLWSVLCNCRDMFLIPPLRSRWGRMLSTMAGKGRQFFFMRVIFLISTTALIIGAVVTNFPSRRNPIVTINIWSLRSKLNQRIFSSMLILIWVFAEEFQEHQMQ